MNKYSYNKELIRQLNIKEFIDKYNFDNEKYNLAIFYSLSSIYEHNKKLAEGIAAKSLLLGDYYSFEYYSMLIEDLEKLKKLTNVMANGYLALIEKVFDINDFIWSILEVWFSFYNKKISIEDKEKLASL